jgi:hypothetical protein
LAPAEPTEGEIPPVFGVTGSAEPIVTASLINGHAWVVPADTTISMVRSAVVPPEISGSGQKTRRSLLSLAG